MKTILKVFLISSLLYACQGIGSSKPSEENDSSKTRVPPDSALNNDNNNAASPETGDPAREATKQLMANLLSSKKEIAELKSAVHDSLSQSGLTIEQRLLFNQTITELDESMKLVNKQVEQIVITDLQESRGKLAEIVQKMKGSQKELTGMIARLDKISNYMQVATSLIQSLSPVPAAKSHSKDDK